MTATNDLVKSLATTQDSWAMESKAKVGALYGGIGAGVLTLFPVAIAIANMRDKELSTGKGVALEVATSPFQPCLCSSRCSCGCSLVC